MQQLFGGRELIIICITFRDNIDRPVSIATGRCQKGPVQSLQRLAIIDTVIQIRIFIDDNGIIYSLLSALPFRGLEQNQYIP
jgi:hypothetical protein